MEAISRNPLDGSVIARYPFLDEGELDGVLSASAAAFRQWSATSVPERQQVLRRLAQILRRDAKVHADMICREMGKPITQALAEIEKCAGLCDWYAENGPGLLADQPSRIGPQAYVSLQPIGPVLAVMPWNFPYWQALRGAVPILLGGNAYLLKHAPNVMGCAYLLQQVWEEAGLVPGAFLAINLTPELVSRAISDRRVAAVAVTGSVRAGSAIASQAGAALKKVVLELGGSDPFIVLADADVDGAVRAAVTGRFQNTGQICIAAKRIILEAPVAAEFTEKFVDAVAALPMGDPSVPSTYLGPMARADLREELHGQVQRSVAAGAQLLMGGALVEGTGNFYAPTVLSGVAPGMAAFDEETFGPVAALSTARDLEHAIELANASEFGLSGAVWTRDRTVARSVAQRVETGGMFVNGFSASDPRVPIGGVKKSGYGRELGRFGLEEFMNVQTVWFDRK